MQTPRLRTFALAAVLVASSACSSTSSRSDDSASTTVADTTTSSVDTSTSLVGDATTTSTAAPVTTAAPATNPPATNPPATNPPATSPPATGPKVVSATFNGPSACPAPDVSVDLPPPSVSISWVVTGADSVFIAIDNPNGPYQSDLPLTGSIDGLPFGCPGTHTYYVVAVKGGQRDTESKSFTAN